MDRRLPFHGDNVLESLLRREFWKGMLCRWKRLGGEKEEGGRTHPWLLPCLLLSFRASVLSAILSGSVKLPAHVLTGCVLSASGSPALCSWWVIITFPAATISPTP